MPTPITPLSHVRGTTLELQGFVKSTSDGGGPLDLTLARYTILVVISDETSQTALLTRQTGSADITQTAAGVWTCKLDAGYSMRGTLPKDRYWLYAGLIDSGVAPAKEWCIGQGPLTLTPSPRG